MTLVSHPVRICRPNANILDFPALHVEPQQKVLILGHSGSGKTTWLSTLAGLLHPHEGDIRFNDQDIYKLTARHRDRMRGIYFGIVFQQLHLLPALNVVQNVTLGLRLTRTATDKERLQDILTQLGLWEKRSRMPHSLSYGEQQRVAIARACIHNPKIIFADEPTSALDDVNAEKTIRLLSAQVENIGASLIVATHDTRIVPYFDHVITLSTEKGVSV